MPWSLLGMLLWPTLASVVLAVAAWFGFRGGTPPLRAGRLTTAVAAGIAVVVTVIDTVLGAAALWFEALRDLSSALFEVRFVLPLVLALPIIVLLGARRPRTAAPSGALLAPRSWHSFVRARWLLAAFCALALIVGLTLAAGMASEPSDAGEYVMYRVDVGSMEMGTTIYGWHHSLVPLALCALLCAVTWWALSRIARPPMAAEHAADTADRRLRSTNTVRIALGALLLLLEAVLHSLATTSRMTGSASDGDVWFSTGTPFAALTGMLSVLAQAAGVLGLALWVLTVLTAVRAPSSARATSTAVPS